MRFWLDKGASGFRVDMAAPTQTRSGKVGTARIWREIRHWLDKDYLQAARR